MALKRFQHECLETSRSIHPPTRPHLHFLRNHVADSGMHVREVGDVGVVGRWRTGGWRRGWRRDGLRERGREVIKGGGSDSTIHALL